ncbi:uncharacterized protein PV09_06010 [Verruconis gallopava]|uniref:Uncharacterized protein n=1 Tax=Verruconis gallopava TaxID=253628 RepID=A0A0D2A7N9_9PEZI|nr:uncharacterized protein PV09_06010 [Verruconis gallopava]KIW02555.1 hypothetical protein PV09_06010 [Verruconis gallopava]
MRLLDSTTLRPEVFLGSNIPKYAILSHTWENEEVSYQDLSTLTFQTKKGWQKIRKTCELARQVNIDWVWVDTCCIDQSSSAELTEAINSMFRWYGRAAKCIAYLSDLPVESDIDSALPRCRWFTRGWTLQELISPSIVQFFDEEWHYRGSKHDLSKQIMTITHIPEDVLLGKTPLSTLPVAQRMSWAAARKTSRLEDAAYCLFGIFDVNMPLLYGEEEKAFRRLQLEIIRSTPDLSIFGWTISMNAQLCPGWTPGSTAYASVLAPSPEAFTNCADYAKLSSRPTGELAISNLGVKATVQLIYTEMTETKGFKYVLPLYCRNRRYENLGVDLRKCGPDQFVRANPACLVTIKPTSNAEAPRERHLITSMLFLDHAAPSTYFSNASLISRCRSGVLQIRLGLALVMHDVWPWARFDDQDQLFFVANEGYGNWDSATLRMGVANHKGRECMFYATGWSAHSKQSLQCSIVDYERFKPAIKDIQDSLVRWNYDRIRVRSSLHAARIPRQPAVFFEGSNDRGYMGISFELTLVKESSVCCRPFWRVEFSCKHYTNKNFPTMARESWSST